MTHLVSINVVYYTLTATRKCLRKSVNVNLQKEGSLYAFLC